jgi:large subunit ribosomal protein L18
MGKYVMPLKRRRLLKTDYSKRLALVKSGLPRAVIRKSLKHMRVDIAEYGESGDRIISHGCTVELKKFGWKSPTGNTPSSYLAGYLAGLRARKKGVEKVVVDLGRQKVVKGSKLLASIKGIRDAGIEVPADEDFFPDDSRIQGKHLKTVGENEVDRVKKLMEESL